MVAPIYPTGIYSAGSISSYARKNGASSVKTSEQRYDQVQFSSHLDEMEKRVKETVGQISRQVRIRPTHQEIETLRQQVADGTYQANPGEIAAHMLLLEGR